MIRLVIEWMYGKLEYGILYGMYMLVLVLVGCVIFRSDELM